MPISSDNRQAGPYVGNNVATAFAFSFKVFAATDLLVILTDALGSENALTLSADYSVALNSNQDSNPGGTVTLPAALASRTKLTITSSIAPLQATDLTNQGGFYPKVITNALDKLTILVQQLFNGLSRSIKLPISNGEDGTLPAGDRSSTAVGFDASGKLALIGLQTGTALADLAASTGSALIGFLQSGVGAVKRSARDKMRDFVSVKDFGAKGDGAGLVSPLGTDDTAAIQAAINSGLNIYFPPGFYRVSTINFSAGGASYWFDSAYIVLGATSQTTAGVVISGWNSSFYNIKIHLNWNQNYTCGVWWYNAGASSQYNSIFGIEILYGFRGMVYGALPGSSSTGYAQSENQIYGWRTRGVQNPFYGNHSNGVLFFSEPIFVAHNEEWAGWAPSSTFNWANARAFENYAGVVVVHGGELQKAGSTPGYAADLAWCRFIGTVVEVACPLQIVDDYVWMESCRHWMTVDGASQYVFKSTVTNSAFTVRDGKFYRLSGIGATSRSVLVDASAAASNNEINIINCDISEWAFVRTAANCPLVLGGTPRYINTRLKQTAADPNIYRLDNTRENLIENRTIDHLGYTTTGWNLINNYGGDTTFTVAADAPSGYLSSCLALNATGDARVITVDETSATTIKNTAFRVRPGELYTIESWLKYLSGSNNLMMVAKFYDKTGVALTSGPNGNGEYFLNDYHGVGSPGTNWTKVFALATVPANSAFMAVGIRCSTTEARFVDMRLRRAS